MISGSIVRQIETKLKGKDWAGIGGQVNPKQAQMTKHVLSKVEGIQTIKHKENLDIKKFARPPQSASGGRRMEIYLEFRI